MPYILSALGRKVLETKDDRLAHFARWCQGCCACGSDYWLSAWLSLGLELSKCGPGFQDFLFKYCSYLQKVYPSSEGISGSLVTKLIWYKEDTKPLSPPTPDSLVLEILHQVLHVPQF